MKPESFFHLGHPEDDVNVLAPSQEQQQPSRLAVLLCMRLIILLPIDPIPTTAMTNLQIEPLLPLRPEVLHRCGGCCCRHLPPVCALGRRQSQSPVLLAPGCHRHIPGAGRRLSCAGSLPHRHVRCRSQPGCAAAATLSSLYMHVALYQQLAGRCWHGRAPAVRAYVVESHIAAALGHPILPPSNPCR